MSANDPWEKLSGDAQHLAITYSAQQGNGDLAGLSGYIKLSNIVYIREYGENEGCRILCYDPVSRTKRMRNVKESADEILQQLGQVSPTYAAAAAAQALPTEPLPHDHFICGTFSKDDNIITGNRLFFRLTAPELIRQSRANKAESVVIFEIAEGDSYKFTLQESPAQLFRLSGRQVPMTLKQKAEAAPRSPDMNS